MGVYLELMFSVSNFLCNLIHLRKVIPVFYSLISGGERGEVMLIQSTTNDGEHVLPFNMPSQAVMPFPTDVSQVFLGVRSRTT